MAYPYRQTKTTSNAVNKYKNYEYGDIAVTVQPGKGLDIKTKQPYKVINLYNIDTTSAKEIVARLTDPSKNRVTRMAWIDKSEPTHVQIKVFESEIDAWLDGGDLNAIQSVLIQSGNYNTNEVYHLEDEIATGFYSVNKDVINKAHTNAGDNALEMWQNYLSKINDPVTLEQIKLYARVYGNVTYGHILSIKNASLIKSYSPDATFVLAPGKWKTMFGRGIKRGAKPLPLYVWVPNSDNVSAADLELAKQNNGWEGVDDTEMSAQVKNDIKMKANKSAGFTIRRVGYDVKDTYLLSGAKEDKWTTEIGLLNNLNGELNNAALQHQAEKNSNKPNVEGGDEMMRRTEKACAWMESYCQDAGIDTRSQYQDASNKLADYLLNYCTVAATKKANILSETSSRVYAENATQITLILTKLGWDALKRFHTQYTYSKKEASALMGVVFGIAKRLEENSMISEGVLSWLKDKATFIKMFIKALKQIGCSIVDTPKATNNNDVDANNAQASNNIEQAKENFKNQFKEHFERISQIIL